VIGKMDWIEESLKIVNGIGYLDKLRKIYPISENIERYVDIEQIKKIRNYYEQRNPVELVKECMKLEKFPIDNPYISILRDDNIFNNNPETVKVIGNILLNMDLENLEVLIKSPKSGSRQYGNSFKAWLKSVYKDNFLSEIYFKNYNGNELKFLKGSDLKLRDYIYDNFGIKNDKGIDFVFRKNNKVYFGEAKFITDYGGTQTNQLNIALDIARKSNNEVGTIAVIDGIPWVIKPYLERIKSVPNNNILTVLLLPEYISNL
jgi:hypothetical protein